MTIRAAAQAARHFPARKRGQTGHAGPIVSTRDS